MYWTLELASKLEDAPWPATKDELIDFAIRSGAPMEVVENLQELIEEEPGFQYETIEDIWPDYPSKEDFFFNELMPHVESKYRIKSDKRFRAISGLSMGGGGTLTYALHRPDLFSAAAPLSSATGSTDVEESLKRIRRYGFEFTRAEMQSLIKANHPLELIKDIPLNKLNSVRWYIDCGDDDYLFEDNSLLHIAFKKRGINHEYRVRDGAHTWTYWRESLPTVLEFVSQGFHHF